MYTCTHKHVYTYTCTSKETRVCSLTNIHMQLKEVQRKVQMQIYGVGLTPEEREQVRVCTRARILACVRACVRALVDRSISPPACVRARVDQSISPPVLIWYRFVLYLC